jgi:predicted amidohydrolase YtcJ
VTTILLRDVHIGQGRVDVRVRGERIEEIGPGLRHGADEVVVDGRGGALLPGLHDHHLHLLAMAAARESIVVGPPAVVDPAGLRTTLRAADGDLPPGQWLRAVGYHESVAGPLDARALDAAVAKRPVRVQHRSGAQWTVNTCGADALGLFDLTRTGYLEGVERDDDGEPTGRLYRLDAWLAQRLPAVRIDLRSIGESLARYGVTGVTDATPFADPTGPALLAAAASSGDLPQAVTIMGGPELADSAIPQPLRAGPVKVVLDEPDLPDLDQVVDWFAVARRAGRAVAVHCVTRASLVLALAAWQSVGARDDDRAEHAAVVPPELADLVRAAGVTVVTQPGFIAERGDQYLNDVDPADVPYLYPCASLIGRGIPVGGSTDAPYTSADPWLAMRAAVTRTTPRGHVIAAAERIPAVRALELFLSPGSRPGRPPRRVSPGAPADLVLLEGPLAAALGDPDHAQVVATIAAGRVIYQR